MIWTDRTAADKYRAVKDAIMGQGLSYGEAALALGAPSRLAIAGVVERNKQNPEGPIVSKLTPKDGLARRRKGAAGGNAERQKKAARKGREGARKPSRRVYVIDPAAEQFVDMEPARDDVWSALPGSTPLSIADHTSGCRWPVGKDLPFLFCCEPVKPDSQYCPAHSAVAFRVLLPKVKKSHAAR